MQKTVKEFIEEKVKKVSGELREAISSYNDTGQEKYWKRMQKYQDELLEIEQYKLSSETISDLKCNISDLKFEHEQVFKRIKNKVSYLLDNCPDNIELQILQEYLNKIN